MNEIWKDIPDYEGIYQASNLGKIKRLSNKKWINKDKGFFRIYPEEILNPFTTPSGYYRINLYKNKKLKSFRVNRLILMAFHRLPLTDEVSMHLDNDRLNNSLNNLKWGSCKENIQQMYREKRNQCIAGSKNPMVKTDESIVIEIKKLYIYQKRSTSEIAKIFDIKYHFVYEIVKNRRWKHITV